MTCVATPTGIGLFHGVVTRSVNESVKCLDFAGNGGYSIERLASDAVGVFTLTLTNVVAGSRVHVEKQSDGTQFYDDVAAGASVVITLSAYGAGSAFNDLRIKVRKASSGTTYEPWETLATAVVGSNSIYVSQIPNE